MVDQNLVRYFKEGLAYGTSLDELKNNLLKEGWSAVEVEAASGAVKGGTTSHSEAIKFILMSLLFLAVISAILYFAFIQKDVSVERIDLKSGIFLDVGNKALQLETDNRSIKVILEEIFSESVKMQIDGKSLSFNLNEDVIINLNDEDEKLLVRLDSIEDGVPQFYFKLIKVEE